MCHFRGRHVASVAGVCHCGTGLSALSAQMVELVIVSPNWRVFLVSAEVLGSRMDAS